MPNPTRIRLSQFTVLVPTKGLRNEGYFRHAKPTLVICDGVRRRVISCIDNISWMLNYLLLYMIQCIAYLSQRTCTRVEMYKFFLVFDRYSI